MTLQTTLGILSETISEYSVAPLFDSFVELEQALNISATISLNNEGVYEFLWDISFSNSSLPQIDPTTNLPSSAYFEWLNINSTLLGSSFIVFDDMGIFAAVASRYLSKTIYIGNFHS